MKGIGGNIKALIQVDKGKTKNAIGELVQTWEDVQTIKGWLDLRAGEAGYTNFYAKVEESTHIFIADYVKLDSRITSENARAIIGGKLYDILLIDNPMEMGRGSQLEIYLKYTGGQ